MNVEVRPFVCLQHRRGLGGGTASESRTDPEDGTEEARKGVLCARCGNKVTTTDRRVEIDGAHRHTFANPHGLVFHIACYSEAPGCRRSGQESTEFAWFAGYGWTVQTCARCGVHLGWAFRSATRAFWGLVCDRLVEDPGAGPDGS
ncbi:MAG: hypothetical protein HY898_25825 [Deltaproteobacteria bacterium]|nr:hypothetical protein [Deltaproteobacteria bacterium]